MPCSAKKPFWIAIYQGQPTALAAPIIPVAMVSAAMPDDAPRQTPQRTALHKATANRRKRLDVMADLSRSCLCFLRRGLRAYIAVFMPIEQRGEAAADPMSRSG